MASYNSSQAFKVARHFQYKNGVNVETLTSTNKDLDYKDSMFQIITSAGVSARAIKLPSPKDGAFFAISTDAASSQDCNVNDHNGATKTTLAASGQGCICVSDGSNWFVVIKA
tara:strand:+ start:464 stop:802 length:339 start_codon:yes stop_codon:yes gene_type:complete